MNDDAQITELLAAWSDGDDTCIERLMPLVEHELRRIAHNYMRRESAGHTLQTTALVNEAFIKLVDQSRANWKNRAQFFGIAAQIMRRILINYARDRAAHKRGGNVTHLDLDDLQVMTEEKSTELLALDEALEKLEKFDKLKSRIVVLRYFGGLTVEETAEVLQIAQPTVYLHWRLARAWLKNTIKP